MKSDRFARTTALLFYSLYGERQTITQRAPFDSIDSIDIDAEYELIRQKKSGLSARQREMVKYRYSRKHRDD